MNHKLDGGKVLREAPIGQQCGNCRHSIPSAIGARVWCFVLDEKMPPADSCCRWQARDE